MEKVYLTFMSLILILFLIGCEENQDKVNLDLFEKNIFTNEINSSNQEETVYPCWYLYDKILACKSDELMMYNFKPNTESIEYIAGYYNESKDLDVIDFNKIQWYSFNTINKVDKKRNNLYLVCAFFVIEGKLIYNYSNDEIINKKTKLYYEIADIDNFKQPTINDNNFLWGFTISKLEQLKTFYKVDYFPITYKDRIPNVTKLYPIINQSGEEYIQLAIGREDTRTNQYIDRTIFEFGKYYNYLSEIMIKKEDYYELENYDKVYFGLISVSDLKKLI